LILYPAIDIQGGRAVRLRQGRFEDETVYRDDPLQAARDWVQAGARYLHVVDLDGARSGEPKSLDHLERIVRESGAPVQYGGGLRSIEAVRAALRAGAARVILGTAAFRDLDFLDAAVAEHASRVVVSVDVRGGCVATAGWTETTELPAADAIRALQDRGVRKFVYTDADRDGMLDGPSLDDVRAISDVVRGRWIYSGGIGTVEHLRSLASLRLVNLAGAISGKALYERAFTVVEGQTALNQH
jgi:phosphoribosylformimino-5-aminoimidazole carboxamide ribotide isomerase